MTKRDELLALAERCEKASEGSRELDAAIEAACKRCGDCDVMFKVKNPHLNQFVPEERGAVSFYAVDDDGEAHLLARRAAPHYTTSLDAAMTLVPKDCGWMTRWPFDGPPTSAYAGRRDGAIHTSRAATPELALCAAALRAQAEMEG